jgi:hypothetical protein
MTNWRKAIGLVLLITATIGFSYRAHDRAGGWMPVPWVDESSFAWPSIAFSESGTLVAPQANPERAAFWMPPGYYLLSATVYHFAGFSPLTMRGIAWAFSILYFLILTHWLYHARWPLECTILAAGFMLNAFFVVMGNVGRMEPIVLSLCLAAYWLIHQEKPWQGFALMGLLMLVHPYAGMFGAFGLLAVLVTVPSSLKQFGRLDALSLVVAAIPWLLYLAYVTHNLPGFSSDMAAQAEGHHEMLAIDRGVDASISTLALSCRALFMNKFTPVLGACVVLAGLVWHFDRPSLLLLMFGMACLLIRMLGAEQWYVVLAVNAILIWLLVAIRFVRNVLLPRLAAPLRLPARLALIGIVIAGSVYGGLIPNPLHYPDNLRWWECSMTAEPYMTKEDSSAVLLALSKIPGLTPASRVEFKPRGESLWFYPASKDQFMTHAPLFTKLKPDFQVVHLHPKLMPLFPDLNINTNNAILLHSRGKHQWYLKQPSPGKVSGR